jgi:5S rRNA maturation endonuclease (ribonuclease M5)
VSADADSDASGEAIAQRIYAQLSGADFQDVATRSE